MFANYDCCKIVENAAVDINRFIADHYQELVIYHVGFDVCSAELVLTSSNHVYENHQDPWGWSSNVFVFMPSSASDPVTGSFQQCVG